MARINPFEPREIARTRDGQPIFIDPKDLILTPEEHGLKNQNVSNERRGEIIRQMADAVLTNAKNFIQQTVVNMFGVPKGDTEEAMLQWCSDNGVGAIQDGLLTIVKVHGKEVRRMRANIDKRFADAVDAMVKRKVLGK